MDRRQPRPRGNDFQDHVYAAWTVFNGASAKVRMAVSRDRGETFAKAVTISTPPQASAGSTYVYPTIDANVYVALVSFPPSGRESSTVHVARSTDDVGSFGAFAAVATVSMVPGGTLPNTGPATASPRASRPAPPTRATLYLTYEDWDTAGGQMDVKFTQSTDGGASWSTPVVVWRSPGRTSTR